MHSSHISCNFEEPLKTLEGGSAPTKELLLKCLPQHTRYRYVIPAKENSTKRQMTAGEHKDVLHSVTYGSFPFERILYSKRK